MIPILYQTPDLTTQGLGALSDVKSCEVTEERNGIYELTMEYPASGVHANEIAIWQFVAARPNYTDDPQLFRIYKIGKEIRGIFTIYAQHISYDLSGYIISSGTASTAATACTLLSAGTPFTITTDKSVVATFNVDVPSSVRSWFAGKSGSLLDVYGTGEFKYDNFNVQLLTNRGSNRGVTIRYGKNLTDLKKDLDASNLVTGVVPYYINEDENVTVGAEVLTGLTLDAPRRLALDCSGSFDETPTAEDLQAEAQAYINSHALTAPTDNITLDFVQVGQLKDRVDLCDTVSIYYEALGVSATAKCIKTTWDVLQDRYTKAEFGDPKTNIADTILTVEKTASDAPKQATSMMQGIVNNATSLITGNLGGHVVLHDSNADGVPDEILIMDTDDINTAVNVWRWNSSGLGYSSTGYDGDYGLAMTMDGRIVADFITTGNLNAGLLTAGRIQDQTGDNYWDLDTGEFKSESMAFEIETAAGDALDAAKNYADTQVDNLDDTIKQYMRYSSGVLELGASDSSYKTQLDNTQLAFLQNDTVVAYISNNKLYITNTKVTDSMQLGKFRWVVDNDSTSATFGRMSLKWVD